MKKIVFIILVSILLIGFISAAFAADKISIIVDGKKIVTDVAPFIDANDRTMVPVRFISEALNAAVAWDPDINMVTVTKGTTKVKLTVDSNQIIVNGNAVTMDTTAIIKDGRTFVPVRYIAEALGLTIGWDDATETVILTSEAESSVSMVMYDDWPTVPDYGALTGANLGIRVVLDSGVTTYNYDILSTPEDRIGVYCTALKENGFIYVTSYKTDGYTRLMYNKGDVDVSIGAKPKYIVVLITKKGQ